MTIAHGSVPKRRQSVILKCLSMDTYCLPVGDTSHPGGTWGAYIEGIGDRPGWNMTRLAKESTIGRSTLYKWRNGQGGVTVDSVLKVAQTVGDEPERALAAAGGRLVNESEDPQLRDIYESDLSVAEKQELVEFVLDQRHRNDDAIRQQVRLMIKAHERKASDVG